jgi:allantoicase
MNPVNELGRARVPFTELMDLASELMSGSVLEASDDFFAPKENLIKSQAAVFIPDKYTENGKWMDGWESRRKRNLTPGDDHDWCVLRLGAAGRIHGVNVDTAHFLGNFPEYCSLEAIHVPGVSGVPKGDWTEILCKSKLQGGTQNLFPITFDGTVTHIRLRIYPDGGVARLRVHGQVRPDWKQLKKNVDLAAAVNGGEVVTCNDMFFGQKDNLILPGRARTMGEGWETRRRRGPGHDWIIVRLATAGLVRKIEVDTNHFKGNFPESCLIEGCACPERNLLPADFRDRADLKWTEILPRTKLQAHHQHLFEKELKRAEQKFDYIRMNIFPDGGVSRLRVFGDIE